MRIDQVAAELHLGCAECTFDWVNNEFVGVEVPEDLQQVSFVFVWTRRKHQNVIDVNKHVSIHTTEN